MGQALYRKYRSKSLDTVVGQQHITETLANALKSGKISHAYLFTGPRGVGKTSIARILAHAINDLPYTDDASHLDIIEIDAASNRRIDEIRELRDKVNVAPTSAKYKVYIIDEVHMLTREAFNALLKTLEEPPAHAVFILATTEAHKLPDTIISRTQRYTFKPVPQQQVVDHLRTLAKQEDIDITDEALALIAQHGEGSFRDSISLLDQTCGYSGQVGLETVQGMLGLPPADVVSSLWQAASQADPAQVVTLLRQMTERGIEAAQIAKLLGAGLRQEIIAGAGDPDRLNLLSDLTETPAAFDPATYLEITLLGYALRGAPAVAAPAPVRPETSSLPPTPATAPPTVQPRATVKAATTVKPATATIRPQTEAKPVLQPESGPTSDAHDHPAAAAEPSVVAGTGTLDATAWPDILGALKQHHNTLYSVVRMGEPEFQPGSVKLRVKFKFHQKRLADAKNQQVICDIIKDATGHTVAFNCVLDAAAEPPSVLPSAPKQQAGAPLAAINDIFGGGELL